MNVCSPRGRLRVADVIALAACLVTAVFTPRISAQQVIPLGSIWSETDTLGGVGIQTLSDMSPSGFTAYHSGSGGTSDRDWPRVWQEFAPLDLSQVGRKVEARFDLRFTATPDVNDSDFRFGFGDRSTNQGMALAMLDLGPSAGTSGRMRYDSSLSEGVVEFIPGDYSGFLSASGTLGQRSGDTTPGAGGGLEDTVTTHSFVVTLERVERNVDRTADGIADVVVNGLYGTLTWTSNAAGSVPYFMDFNAATIEKDVQSGLGVFEDSLADGGRINQVDSLGFNLYDAEPFLNPGTGTRDGGYTVSNFTLRYWGPSNDAVFDIPAGVAQTQAQAGYPVLTTENATSVTKTGGGTVVFDVANTHTGPTQVEAGTLEITAAGAVQASPLSVRPGGTVTIPSSGRLVVTTPGLAVDEQAGGGRLDLGVGQVSIGAGGITGTDLRADIIAGRSGGSWNGTSGITSTAAAASGGTRAVGYVVAPDGSAQVSFAAPGDVDLNGQVNVFDLVSVNSSGKYGTGQSAVWNQGDFNYDGATNVFDLVGINTAAVYGQGNYFPAAGAGGVAAVPEPIGWLPLIGTAGWLAWARRQRRMSVQAGCDAA